MALQSHPAIDAPIIELDEVDSTNNYAMGLINADTAYAGLTIIANRQNNGKGQRGKSWQDEPGQSLLMSLIALPGLKLDRQFLFIAQVAVAIADTLQALDPKMDVAIKWPNDIIINDKKAGGVLIENVIRGNQWLYAIVGFGLNVLQAYMPAGLPHATSLKIACGKNFQIIDLANLLRQRILRQLEMAENEEDQMSQYNAYLFKKGQGQKFAKGGEEWMAEVLRVNLDGTLTARLMDGTDRNYIHGNENWQWD